MRKVYRSGTVGRWLLAGAVACAQTACMAQDEQSGLSDAEIASLRQAVKEKISLRSDIPVAEPLDGIYPPMSSRETPRWRYLTTQYDNWYGRQSPALNEGVRGGGNGEAWRYDPMKTLQEACRRSELVGERNDALCRDAELTITEFLERQHWGSRGRFPDCSGGLVGVTRGSGKANKCDFKYGGHASAIWYAEKAYGKPSYTYQQKQLMKEFCYRQGWAYGWIDVDGLEDGFTERFAGLSLQCLVDLHKAGVDTKVERQDAIGKLYAMFAGDFAGELIGAPMHSINGHECSNKCSGPEWEYWMFSPWMGASFLIPALWEYWVFVEQDLRVAEMIVLYGQAMLDYGIVQPETWAPGEGPWRTKGNPTKWLTLYFALPLEQEKNVQLQNGDGWFSDLHNPESIFALNAAYFFSCDEAFAERSRDLAPWFDASATREDPGNVHRTFLWQHRGSASTEWLLENAQCGGTTTP